MKTVIGSVLLAVTLGASMTAFAQPPQSVGAAVFNQKGELLLPEGFREWVFIGAPLTPHGLNNGKAAFPEFHHVYVNPDAYAVYRQTGEFPDGTVIAKELVLLQKGNFPDGSSLGPSGRGYFAGEFQGMDVMVKDSQRFKASNGWGFFNFGHHAPPYLPTAQAASAESCSGCHTANAGKGMVFTQYYPVL
ncbi:MAG: cytochrome P460 family protein [Gammaproteobacteria bacterium]